MNYDSLSNCMTMGKTKKGFIQQGMSIADEIRGKKAFDIIEKDQWNRMAPYDRMVHENKLTNFFKMTELGLTANPPSFVMKYINEQKLSRDEETSTSLEAVDDLETDESDCTPFACSVCDEIYDGKLALVEHSLEHIGNVGPFSCMFCSKIFSDKYKLKRHIKSHSGKNDFQCNICGKQYLHKGNLVRHCNESHPENIAVAIQIKKPLNGLNSPMSKSSLSTQGKNKVLQNHKLNKPVKLESPKNMMPSLKTSKQSSKTVKKVSSANVFNDISICRKDNINKKKSNLSTKFSPELETPQKTCRGVEFIPPESRMQMEYTIVTNEMNKQKLFQCRYCPKTSPKKNSIQSHVYMHTGERPFSCSLCDKKFTQNTYLRLHVENMHKTEHIDSVHQGTALQSGGSSEVTAKKVPPASQNVMFKKAKGSRTDTFKCDMCDSSYSRRDNLNKHILRRHRKDTTSSSDIENEGNRKDIPIDISTSKRNSSSNKKGIKNTQKYKQKSNQYACNMCNETFDHEEQLDDHACSCNILNRSTSFWNMLQNNEPEQSNLIIDELFYCNVCNKGYKTEKNLKTHKLCHTNDLFCCRICPKRFFRLHSLQSHMKTHEMSNSNLSANNFQKLQSTFTPVKNSKLKDLMPPFTNLSSNTCQYTETELNKSQEKLEVVKPNLCQTCGKRFAKKVNLTRHMNNCMSKSMAQFVGREKDQSISPSSRVQMYENVPIHPDLHNENSMLKSVASKKNSHMKRGNTPIKYARTKLNDIANTEDLNNNTNLSNQLESNSFLSKSKLYLIFSQDPVDNKEDFETKCNRCGREYRYKASLEKHKINCEGQTVTQFLKEKAHSEKLKTCSEVKKTTPSKGQRHNCTLCHLSMKISDLSTHHLQHIQNSIHKCNLCEKFFLSQFSLDQHLDVCIWSRSNLRSQSVPSTYEKQNSYRRARSLSPVSNHKINTPRGRDIERGKGKKCIDKNHDTHTGAKCGICGTFIVQKRNLIAHMDRHRRKQFTEMIDPDLENVPDNDIREYLLAFTEEKCFECQVCEKYFTDKDDIEKHMLKHKRNNFKCNICKEVFSWGEQINMHMLFCRVPSSSYSCKQCPKTFSSHHSLNLHMNIHLEKKHECKICNKRFSMKQLLNIHLHKIHNTVQQVGHGNFQYNQLEVANNEGETDQIVQLQRMKEMQHSKKKNGIDRALKINETNTNESLKNNYECHLCQKQFNARSDIKIHLQEHNIHHMKDEGKPIIECSLCKKRLKSESSLIKHCRKKHGKNCNIFICDICFLILNSKDDLVHHMAIHNVKDDDDFCEKNFSNESSLEENITTYEENKFSSKTFNKVISNEKSMEEHELTDNEKYYNCVLCEKAFTNNRNMQSHMKRCIRERYLLCNNCNRKFVTKKRLRLHMKECRPSSKPMNCLSSPEAPSYDKHKNTFNKLPNCKLCSSKFKTKGQLNVHMNVHNNKIPQQRFECIICGVQYILLGTLLNHMVKRHSVQESISCNICLKILPSCANLRIHMIYHTKEITTDNKDVLDNADMSPTDVRRKLDFSILDSNLNKKSCSYTLNEKEKNRLTEDFSDLDNLGIDVKNGDMMSNLKQSEFTENKGNEGCTGSVLTLEAGLDFSTVIDMEEELSQSNELHICIDQEQALHSENENEIHEKERNDLSFELYLSEDDMDCNSNVLIEETQVTNTINLQEFEGESNANEINGDNVMAPDYFSVIPHVISTDVLDVGLMHPTELKRLEKETSNKSLDNTVPTRNLVSKTFIRQPESTGAISVTSRESDSVVREEGTEVKVDETCVMKPYTKPDEQNNRPSNESRRYDQNRFKCQICSKEYSYVSLLKNHLMKIHNNMDYAYCIICNTSCSKREDMFSHMNIHINDLNPIGMEINRESDNSKIIAKEILKKENFKNNIEKTPLRYALSKTLKAVNDWDFEKVDLIKLPKDNVEMVEKDENTDINIQKNTTDFEQSVSDMTTYTATANNTPELFSSKVTEKISNGTDIKVNEVHVIKPKTILDHQKHRSSNKLSICDENRYECNICKNKFSNLGILKNHLIVIHNNKDYSYCIICDTPCSDREDMYTHMVIHIKDLKSVEECITRQMDNYKTSETESPKKEILKRWIGTEKNPISCALSKALKSVTNLDFKNNECAKSSKDNLKMQVNSESKKNADIHIQKSTTNIEHLEMNTNFPKDCFKIPSDSIIIKNKDLKNLKIITNTEQIEVDTKSPIEKLKMLENKKNSKGKAMIIQKNTSSNEQSEINCIDNLKVLENNESNKNVDKQFQKIPSNIKKSEIISKSHKGTRKMPINEKSNKVTDESVQKTTSNIEQSEINVTDSISSAGEDISNNDVEGSRQMDTCKPTNGESPNIESLQRSDSTEKILWGCAFSKSLKLVSNWDFKSNYYTKSPKDNYKKLANNDYSKETVVQVTKVSSNGDPSDIDMKDSLDIENNLTESYTLNATEEIIIDEIEVTSKMDYCKTTKSETPKKENLEKKGTWSFAISKALKSVSNLDSIGTNYSKLLKDSLRKLENSQESKDIKIQETTTHDDTLEVNITSDSIDIESDVPESYSPKDAVEMANETSESLVCNVCNKNFVFRKTLDQHIKTHELEQSSQKELDELENPKYSTENFIQEAVEKNDKIILETKDHKKTGDDLPKKINSTKKSVTVSGPNTNDSFVCNVCDKIYESKKSLNRHIKTHQLKQTSGKELDEQEMLKCSKDPKKSVDVPKEMNYTKISVTVPEQNSDVAKRTCNHCNTTFSRKDTVQKHLKGQHCPALKNKLPDKMKIEKQKSILILKPECNICGVIYSTKEDLAKHLLTHAVDKSNAAKQQLDKQDCPELKNYSPDKTLSDKMKIEKQTTVSILKIFCDICGEIYSTKEDLAKHLLTHAEDKSDSVKKQLDKQDCSASKQKSPDKKEIERQKSNSILKPECNICGEIYCTKEILDKHLLTHAAEGELDTVKQHLDKQDCPALRNISPDKTFSDKKKIEKQHSTSFFKPESNFCGENSSTNEVLAKHLLTHAEDKSDNVKHCLNKQIGPAFENNSPDKRYSDNKSDTEKQHLDNQLCPELQKKSPDKTFSDDKSDTEKQHLENQDCPALQNKSPDKKISDKMEIEKQIITSNLKPECNICGELYSTKEDLVKHLLTHAEDKSDCWKDAKLQKETAVQSHVSTYLTISSSRLTTTTSPLRALRTLGNLLTTSASPLKTSASPLKTSASPLKTSASPLTTSASPLTTSASPLTTSASPLTTSASPLTNSSSSLTTSLQGSEINMTLSANISPTKVCQGDTLLLKNKKPMNPLVTISPLKMDGSYRSLKDWRPSQIPLMASKEAISIVPSKFYNNKKHETDDSLPEDRESSTQNENIVPECTVNSSKFSDSKCRERNTSLPEDKEILDQSVSGILNESVPESSLSGRYQCKICQFRCTVGIEMNEHLIRNHSNKKPSKCLQCQEDFSGIMKLRKHMNTHMKRILRASPISLMSNKETFSIVPSSSEISTSPAAKRKKIDDSCFIDDNTKVILPLDKIVGSKFYNNKKHETDASLPEEGESSNKNVVPDGKGNSSKFSDNKCSERNTTVTKDKEILSQSASGILIESVPDSSLSGRYECKICQFRCTVGTKMNEHLINNHSNKKPSKCLQCQEDFPGIVKLRKHMNIHMKKICRDKSRFLKSKDDLSDHKLENKVPERGDKRKDLNSKLVDEDCEVTKDPGNIDNVNENFMHVEKRTRNKRLKIDKDCNIIAENEKKDEDTISNADVAETIESEGEWEWNSVMS